MSSGNLEFVIINDGEPEPSTGDDVSHPGSRKLNRSLHTCAQDVQITRTANNMVNKYNISLNYKLESLQNDPWV
jgi:hypothetical protein